MIWIHTSAFDIDEVHIMSGGVNYSPEEHTVCDLAVKPNVLIGRESPRQFGPDNLDYVSQHGQKDEAAVEG